MRPAYIGITGVTSKTELAAVTNILPTENKQLVMVGVLASSRTIRGEPNKFPRRYPRPADLGSIFSDQTHRLNLVHFNTKEPHRLVNDLSTTRDLAGPYCHGFQLNMAWPDCKALGTYKARFPRDTLVLQCGGKALDEVGRDPLNLALRAKEYIGLVEYVLVDPSGGTGTEFDPRFAFHCVDCLNDELWRDNIGIVVAGGLHAGNLTTQLSRIMRQFKGVSIDAEGRLRNPADDTLNIEYAQAYLLVAYEAYVRLQACI